MENYFKVQLEFNILKFEDITFMFAALEKNNKLCIII